MKKNSTLEEKKASFSARADPPATSAATLSFSPVIERMMGHKLSASVSHTKCGRSLEMPETLSAEDEMIEVVQVRSRKDTRNGRRR